MARRRKGRRQKPSIALAPLIPVTYPLYKAYKMVGFTGAYPAVAFGELTGYDPIYKQFNSWLAMRNLGGLAAGIVVHKIFNRTGINRHVRRLTGGWFSI